MNLPDPQGSIWEVWHSGCQGCPLGYVSLRTCTKVWEKAGKYHNRQAVFETHSILAALCSSPLPPPSWLLSCLLDISSQCPFGVCVWWWWWLPLELHCAPRLCLQLWSHFILPSLPGKSPQLSSIWCQDLNPYLQADFLLEGQQLLGHQFPDNPQVPRAPSDQNCPLIITPGSFKADPSSLF